MRKLFYPILLIAFLCFSNAFATDYYVSANTNPSLGSVGDDKNNGLTPYTPFKTLNKLKFFLRKGGDRGLIFSGTYNEYVTFDYGLPSSNPLAPTNLNPITVEPYGNGSVIIDGYIIRPNPANLSSIPHLVNIQTNHFVLKNIEIRNSANASVAVNADGVILDNLYVHNGYSIGIGGGGLYSTVKNCKLHDFYDYPDGGNADGISFTCQNPGPGVGNHTIYNNLVYNCSDDGIDTWKTSNNIIEKNVVYNTGYYYDIATNTYISAPHGDGNGIKAGGGPGTGWNIIKNNISYHNKASGFDSNSGTTNTYYNNTSYGNGKGFGLLSAYDVLKNNLAINNNIIINYANVVGTTSYNSWNLGITDPLFVNIDPYFGPLDFNLQRCSPAINVGYNVGILYKCGIPDLGAVESIFCKPSPKQFPCNTFNKKNEIEIKELSISPNPLRSNSKLFLPHDIEIKEALVKIYDYTGKEIKKFEVKSNEIPFSKDDFSNGMYLYKFINNNEIINQGKFIVE